MIHLHITGETPQELEAQFTDLPLVANAVERWAILWLRARGHSVSLFGPAETPSQFCARLGISNQNFHHKTRDPRAEGLFKATWGSGTIRSTIRTIESSQEFDAFCLDARALDGLKPLPAAA